VEAVLKVRSAPEKEILDLIGFFTADEYFDILKFIDSIFMKKNFPRLSALLQNLI